MLTFFGRDLEALAAVSLGEGGLAAGLFVGHVCKVQQEGQEAALRISSDSYSRKLMWVN